MSKLKGISMLAILAMALLVVAACSNANKETARNTEESSDKIASTASNTEPPPAADNTGRNAANPDAPGPPFEQGTSESDMQTTQRVRQGLMDDTTLSTTAKNVKVITNEGKVLLLGPVTNEQERSRIESIAEGVVGAGNVRSELEVTHS